MAGKRSILPLFILCSLAAFSQPGSKFKTTLRFEFGVPTSKGNNAFAESFTGIYDLGTSVSFGFSNINLGLFFKYKQFQVPANKIPGLNTLQNTLNPGLQLSYDAWLSKGVIFAPSVYVGYNMIAYQKVSCKKETAVTSGYTGINIQPTINFYFMIDEWFGIGAFGGYNILTYNFNPNDICLNEFKSYTADDKVGNTRFVTFGFSAYYDFARKGDSGL